LAFHATDSFMPRLGAMMGRAALGVLRRITMGDAMRKALISCFAGLVLSVMPGAANAALIQTPLPANTFISFSGLDWAWAYPLSSASPGFDISFQSGFGWRLPTLAELASAPDATDFIFPGANVPLGGSDPVSGASFLFTN